MTKKIIISVILSLGAFLLQSTVLQSIALFGAVPDLALGIVIYTACQNGVMAGQLSGFFSGLILDLMSASPLGFHSLIRTLTGALAGLLNGIFFLDYFLFPMLLCFGGTLFKGLVIFLLSLVFSGSLPSYSFLTPVFWVELGMNTLSAPLVFGLLRLVDRLLAGKRKS